MQPTSARGVPQTLDNWEAVPIVVPLEDAGEAARIERAWTPVRVPWHWQLEDAFAAYEGFVLYRCRFAHGRPPVGTMVSLRFRGVYYAARVWLNGVYLGDHEGYFSAFEFDVTDAVITDGENELLVEVYSPEETEENDRKTIGGVWAMWDGMAHHINPGGISKRLGSCSMERYASGPSRQRRITPGVAWRMWISTPGGTRAQDWLVGYVRSALRSRTWSSRGRSRSRRERTASTWASGCPTYGSGRRGTGASSRSTSWSCGVPGQKNGRVLGRVPWSCGTGRYTSTASVYSCAGSTTFPRTPILQGRRRDAFARTPPWCVRRA